MEGLSSRGVKLDGAILAISATDGIIPKDRDQIFVLSQSGVPRVVVFLDNCHMIDDQELTDLVEMEVRDVLDEYGFDGEKTPIIRGSSPKALEGDRSSEQSIKDLMSSVDSWITPFH